MIIVLSGNQGVVSIKIDPVVLVVDITVRESIRVYPPVIPGKTNFYDLIEIEMNGLSSIGAIPDMYTAAIIVKVAFPVLLSPITR